ncbi:MAG: AAA family ATPase [Mariprofundaceae bacterium]
MTENNMMTEKRVNQMIVGLKKQAQKEATKSADKKKTARKSRSQVKSTLNVGEIQLFDVEAVKRKKKEMPQHDRYKVWHDIVEKMLETEGVAKLVPQPKNMAKILDKCEARYPHFIDLIDYLRGVSVMNSRCDHPCFNLGAHLLLDGPAGVGKSSFLQFLAREMDVTFLNQSCADATAGFIMTGSAIQWNTSKQGKIASLLIHDQCPNALIMLDEIDKLPKSDDKFPFSNTLYRLLEKGDARMFTDEYLEIAMDASKINWVATSNNVSKLEAPIRDRFKVISVRAPNYEERKSIVSMLYTDTRKREAWGKSIQPVIGDKAIRLLAQVEGSVRVMQQVLEASIVHACQRSKGKQPSVTPADVEIVLKSRRVEKRECRSIGFL